MGNRFQEKLALEHAGTVYAALGDHAQSLAAFEHALELAREAGDRHHEADLLWYMAVQHAEQDQRDKALERAQASLELFKALKNPYVGWLTDHLHQYRVGDGAGRLGAAGQGPQPGSLGGSWVVGGAQPTQPGPTPPASGPGLLRMAHSAVKSVGKFLGSGLQTVPAPTYQSRLQVCGACEHHTGVRCKLCGCFTSVKAWLPHEGCPIGKW
jgi:tetratricopeptide (TPR) repeat protein